MPLENIQDNFLPTSDSILKAAVSSRLEFAGVGYNILTGNPMNCESKDPGITKQIYDFTYRKNKPSQDGLHQIPD